MPGGMREWPSCKLRAPSVLNCVALARSHSSRKLCVTLMVSSGRSRKPRNALVVGICCVRNLHALRQLMT